MEINKKIKQIFYELHKQFSDEYDDSQILIAAYAMYESLGENITELIILIVITSSQVYQKALTKPWKIHGKFYTKKLKISQHSFVKNGVTNEKTFKKVDALREYLLEGNYNLILRQYCY